MSRQDKASAIATTYFSFFPGRYSNDTPYSSRSKCQRKIYPEESASNPLKVLFSWSFNMLPYVPVFYDKGHKHWHFVFGVAGLPI
jgi:hypothetical protein